MTTSPPKWYALKRIEGQKMTNKELSPTPILTKFLKSFLQMITIWVILFTIETVDLKAAAILTKISVGVILLILFVANVLLYKQLQTIRKDMRVFLKKDGGET